MHTTFFGVNDAFEGLVRGVYRKEIPTVKRPSRYGDVLMIPEPVTITYARPLQRVLFNRARDCNPFFHLYEALWMLAGRNDVEPLAYYNSRMREFSDDGETFNGAYGYRWRIAKAHEPCLNESGHESLIACTNFVDQLPIIIDHLRRKPESRRAVLQMWNVRDDLLQIDGSKDVCCNTCVYFMIDEGRLDMTVSNRSNDMIWGMLGANVVHMSMLQEYVAAQLEVGLGAYNQFTNNLHVYTNRWEPAHWLAEYGPRDMHSPPKLTYETMKLVPLVRDPAVFDAECSAFVEHHRQCADRRTWREPFLETVAQPMCLAFHWHKQRCYPQARQCVNMVKADDWRTAGQDWLEKRERLWKADRVDENANSEDK